jgi:hypothetical protein
MAPFVVFVHSVKIVEYGKMNVKRQNAIGYLPWGITRNSTARK